MSILPMNFSLLSLPRVALLSIIIFIQFFIPSHTLFSGLIGRHDPLVGFTKFCEYGYKSESGSCSACTTGPSWDDGSKCLYDDVLTGGSKPPVGQQVRIYLDEFGKPQWEYEPCGDGEFCLGNGQLFKQRCQRGLHTPPGVNNKCEVCDGIHTGFYGDNGNCYSCPSGMVPDTSTDYDCKPAPYGFYSDGFGMIPLPPGFYNQLAADNLSGTLKPAHECSGYTSSSGQCLQCPTEPEYQVAHPILNACIPCPTGHECPTGRWDDVDPCPEGFVSPEGSQLCTACATGFYGYERSECLPCVDGQYYDSRNAICKDCEAGYYCTSVTAPDPGARIACPGGTFSGPNQLTCDECSGMVTKDRSQCLPVNGARGVGSLCSFGHFYNPGSSAPDNCDECPPGYRCPNDFTVVPCPRGWVAEPGSEECTRCAAGAHPNNERTQCLLCSDGTYWNNEQGACLTCPVNHRCVRDLLAPCPEFFSALAGSYECRECEGLILGFDVHLSTITGPIVPGGTCCSDAGTDCTCARGDYFKVEYDEDAELYYGECTPCPKGHACFDSRKIECPRGLYQNNIQMDSCLKCHGGYPVDVNDDPYHSSNEYCSYCAETRPGTYIDEVFLTCNSCSEGYYCVDGQKIECPEHMYQPKSLQTTCLKCPGTVSIDRTSCEPCEPGFYFDSESRCIECPVGHYCTDGLMIGCPKGYYANFEGMAACVECSGQVNSDSSACLVGVGSSLLTYQRGIDGENPLMVWLTWLFIFAIAIGVYFLIRVGCFHLALAAGMEKPKKVEIK